MLDRLNPGEKVKDISILEYINYILFFNQFRIYAIYF